MTEWTKTAWVFPGQGSQMVGMGKDFAEAYPAARALFEQADDLLGFSLSALCFDGPEEALNDTLNTQPALYVCSAAILQVLREALPDIYPACVAGHSMGELTALFAAGALRFEDGLRLVRERGRLMKQAGETSPGAMAAILGLEADAIRELCAQATVQTGKPVVLANDNCPGQIVISGDSAALEAAMQLAEAAGARKVVKLAVSIAAHSPLMQTVVEEFQAAVNAASLQPPQVPVYGNITAQPLPSVRDIQQELGNQLTQSVRWTESVQAIRTGGAEMFIEIGSGDVLTGLIKRIDRQAARVTLNSVQALQAFLAEQ